MKSAPQGRNAPERSAGGGRGDAAGHEGGEKPWRIAPGVRPDRERRAAAADSADSTGGRRCGSIRSRHDRHEYDDRLSAIRMKDEFASTMIVYSSRGGESMKIEGFETPFPRWNAPRRARKQEFRSGSPAARERPSPSRSSRRPMLERCSGRRCFWRRSRRTVAPMAHFRGVSTPLKTVPTANKHPISRRNPLRRPRFKRSLEKLPISSDFMCECRFFRLNC